MNTRQDKIKARMLRLKELDESRVSAMAAKVSSRIKVLHEEFLRKGPTGARPTQLIDAISQAVAEEIVAATRDAIHSAALRSRYGSP